MKTGVTLKRRTVRTRARDGTESVYVYWCLRWYDAGGKEKKEYIGRVDEVGVRDARRLRDLKQATLEVQPQLRSRRRSPSLEEFAGRFTAWKEAQGASGGTREAYDFTIRLLKEHFGPDRAIDTIEREHAEDFLRALLAGRLNHVYTGEKKSYRMGRTTIAKHLRHVRALFQHAADPDRGDPIIDRNPFKRVRTEGDPIPAKKFRRVTEAQVGALMREAPGGWRSLVGLCYYAALRRSDALALTWDNVDEANGVLRFAAVKTGKVQEVPVVGPLERLLGDERRRQSDGGTYRPGGLVVLQRADGARRSRDPGYVRVGNIGRRFKTICARAAVPFYPDPCHTLRKSRIDEWARRHPPNVVQAWAGHSSLATTMKHYAQVGPEDAQRERAHRGPKGGPKHPRRVRPVARKRKETKPQTAR